MKKLILDRDVKIYAHLQENGNHYVIPPAAQPKSFVGNAFLWALDEGEDTCSLLQTTGGYRVRHSRAGVDIFFDADYSTVVYKGVPSCDFLGNAFCVRVDGSDALERAMANFYWKSILNQCAERSFYARKKAAAGGLCSFNAGNKVLWGHLPRCGSRIPYSRQGSDGRRL